MKAHARRAAWRRRPLRIGARAGAGSAQDAPDDDGIHFFGEGEFDNRGAGSEAGEGGPGTGSLIAGDEGGRAWHGGPWRVLSAMIDEGSTGGKSWKWQLSRSHSHSGPVFPLLRSDGAGDTAGY
ncbi:MAG: hypothetical protein ACM30E_04590 [Nitrososphaerales archaeon]